MKLEEVMSRMLKKTARKECLGAHNALDTDPLRRQQLAICDIVV